MAERVNIRRPQYFPHRGVYAYTKRGFDRKVVPRLRALGMRQRDVEWVRKVYFYHVSLCKYFDADGYYRNIARCHLYELSRKMKNDRKMPLFFMLLRSRLFWVGFDAETQRVAWIRSPAAERAFPRIFKEP